MHQQLLALAIYLARRSSLEPVKLKKHILKNAAERMGEALYLRQERPSYTSGARTNPVLKKQHDPARPVQVATPG